jgi:response regulator RpfG family c-di-GMP phosphodiesterase
MERKLNYLILIDDDRSTNFLHKMVIQKAIEVNQLVVFQKAKEALVFLVENYKKTNQYPELILLDINMPEMDGWEFIEEYNRLNNACQSQVMVCMLSTSLNPDDKTKAENLLGQKSFMNKPLTREMITSLYDEHFT